MRDHFSDLECAKYDVVHDYPGGAVKLGPKVGINPGTLSNKVNASIDTHHLTVDEAIVIQNTTKDFRIIEAEARALDGIFVHLGDMGTVGDMDLLDAWARWHQDTGETAFVIRKALDDKKITKAELEDIRKEMFEDFEREMDLLKRLEAICDE